METLKEFGNILLGHKIEVFIDHNNLTYETIESASQSLQFRKSLMQKFGMTLLYIKGDSNVVAYAFIYITMIHRTHKLLDTTIEEDTCEILCLGLLLISDNTDCLYLDIEEISFLLAPHIMEA